MMNYPEIAIISAAIVAYLESEGDNISPIDGTRLKALIAAAVAAFLDIEQTATV